MRRWPRWLSSVKPFQLVANPFYLGGDLRWLWSPMLTGTSPVRSWPHFPTQLIWPPVLAAFPRLQTPSGQTRSQVPHDEQPNRRKFRHEEDSQARSQVHCVVDANIGDVVPTRRFNLSARALLTCSAAHSSVGWGLRVLFEKPAAAQF